MRKLFILIAPLLFLVRTLFADSIQISWEASPSGGLAGYRVYYGTNSGAYDCVTNSGLVLTQRVDLPRRGRWFFAVTAYDTNGVESDFSNEAQFQSKPLPPVLHGANVVRITPVIECSTNLVNWVAMAGEPTFFAATNNAEFFRTARLRIELVRRIEE